jgi:hypothetical protein
LFGVANDQVGLEDEINEAHRVFQPIKNREWLGWAGELLMADLVKEVEEEQRVEAAKRAEEEAEAARAAAEEIKKR